MQLFLTYLASTDHRHIGLLYGFTSFFFLLIGFFLAIVIRWQLAYPGVPLPLVIAQPVWFTPTRTAE